MPNGVAQTDNPSHRTGGKTERDRLAEGERMLLDRSHGMQLSALSKKYGLSTRTVALRLQQALDARLATTVDQYREQQNAAIDHLMDRNAAALALGEALVSKAIQTNDLGLAERGLDRLTVATNTLLRLHERRAKLNGLDRPVEVAVTVHEVTQEDLAIQELIRESHARMAADVREHLGHAQA